MGKLEQLEECGENDPKVLANFPKEESQYWPEDGRRISMHQKQHEKVRRVETWRDLFSHGPKR